MTQSVPPPKPPALVQHLTPKQISPPRSREERPFAVAELLTARSPASPAATTRTAAAIAIKKAVMLGSEVTVSYGAEQFDIAQTDIGIEPIGKTERKRQKVEENFICSAAAICHRTSAVKRPAQPIPAFRPSGAIVKFNKLLAQVTTPTNPSELNQTRPQELDFRAPTPSSPSGQTQPPQQAPQPTPTNVPATKRRVIEVNSDRQEYDANRRIVTAEGRVEVRLQDGVLNADRLQVSIPNLIAVGEGNVVYTTGKQVLRGERFTFNIVQDSGTLQGGRGEIFIPSASQDFAAPLESDVTTSSVLPGGDRFTPNQPLQQVTNAGGLNINYGSKRGIAGVPPLNQKGGTVKRLRFEAETINFYREGWQAQNVRITNDPFSPPELELRADRVTLVRETPQRDRIRTQKQRLVFDQRFSLPIPRDQAVIDRNQRETNPALAQIGFDGDDRGGIFIERNFPIFNADAVQFSVTPQFFVQKAIDEGNGNFFDSEYFGLRANLRASTGLRNAITGSAILTSLDLGDLEDNLRGSLRFQQLVGGRLAHTVSLEASYRDRLYNGTLGYQDVQSSIGGIVNSPIVPLGNTGINLSYQLGYQYINANTDRLELLDTVRENDRASLGRFQGSVALNRGFLLWEGKGLPATAEQGLKYTPVPVVPYLAAFAGVTGTSSFYSNGDNQSTLIGTVGIEGQIGHFSRPFLDYTRVNVSYSEGLRSGISPFLFDRAADTRVLGFGFTQQLYGPFRIGFQTSFNLDNNDTLSTDYVLEYSRRTYGVVLRYNPELEIGSISLRISDFNWTGGGDPFSTTGVRPVVGGVERGD
ncbi:DUF3769 domain-containing protein [Cyanosarcina cf. burmensis CCALA 770]|nr:DUF3769 domain-containing protein [Cyanosarcina cf. burmensis CCALA 770]